MSKQTESPGRVHKVCEASSTYSTALHSFCSGFFLVSLLESFYLQGLIYLPSNRNASILFSKPILADKTVKGFIYCYEGESVERLGVLFRKKKKKVCLLVFFFTKRFSVQKSNTLILKQFPLYLLTKIPGECIFCSPEPH